MSESRAASFEVTDPGWRGRAMWAMAGLERAARWMARHVAAPGEFAAGVREQWRRVTQPDRTRHDAAAKDDATGLVVVLPALPWEYRRQRPQQLARALAENGRRVLYLDVPVRTSIVPPPRLRADEHGVEVLSVAVPGRPDPYTSVLSAEQTTYLADVFVSGLRRRPDFILVQLPFWGPLGAELSRRLQVPLVYDRIDLHAEFPGVPALVGTADAALASQAQYLIASSPGLAELGPAGASWQIIPNGVVLEDFAGLHQDGPPRGAPVAGYVGALGAWFDADAVASAARELSAWTFRLAGRVEDERVRALARLPNVRLVGEIPYARVPEFLSRVDVGLVPFRDEALTRAVDAVKLYEYLAAGLPVVARELPGLRRWGPPAVYHYARPDELAAAITRAANEDHQVEAARRRDLIQAETWRARAAAVLAVVGRP